MLPLRPRDREEPERERVGGGYPPRRGIWLTGVAAYSPCVCRSRAWLGAAALPLDGRFSFGRLPSWPPC